MTLKKMDDVRNAQFKVDEFKQLPDGAKQELEAHRQLYLKDPENAHIWDPIVIGTPGGPVPTLLLRYTGRKSGRALNTVLQYFRLKGKIAIVASRGGTAESPLWYHNLIATPDCRVQIGKFASTATARVLEGVERKEWWEYITKTQAAQAEYQSRTSRAIPVVVLELPEGTSLDTAEI